jgi:hypothetical protein
MNWWTARQTWQKIAIAGAGGVLGIAIVGGIVSDSTAGETAAAPSTTLATTSTVAPTTTLPPTTTVAPTTTITTTTTVPPTTTIATTTTVAPTTTLAPTTTATTTTTVAPTTTAAANCDSSYPDFCIPPKPPHLNCPDIGSKNFTVLQPDPHGFDRDKDGVGCESCHGAGGDYTASKTMKAIAGGAIEAESVGLIIPDEAVCIGCHNEESPAFKGFVFEEMLAKIAHPLPEERRAKYQAAKTD